jgi:2-polyprenyl-6-methoxyphenol hydroxylase-like FAD-dependent oxidoreductase
VAQNNQTISGEGKWIHDPDTEMTRTASIAVIGGGIGGLTAALALLKRGLDVEVYEQATRLGEVGAGIQISANGTRVLVALGLEEALREIQVSPLRKEIRHWRTGQAWKWYELGPSADQRYGSPHVLLHRGDLHDMLVKAVQHLKPDAIHLAKRCVDIGQSDEHVDLRFADGDMVQAGFVVGADGIHSEIRAHLFGPSRPEFTGCVAWRAVVPMQRVSAEAEAMVSTNWLGPRGHVLHYPLRGGDLMNFLGIVERDDWQVESWTIEGTASELANDFAGWHPRYRPCCTHSARQKSLTRRRGSTILQTSDSGHQDPFNFRPATAAKRHKVPGEVGRAHVDQRRLEARPCHYALEPRGEMRPAILPHARHPHHSQPIDVRGEANVREGKSLSREPRAGAKFVFHLLQITVV